MPRRKTVAPSAAFIGFFGSTFELTADSSTTLQSVSYFLLLAAVLNASWLKEHVAAVVVPLGGTVAGDAQQQNVLVVLALSFLNMGFDLAVSLEAAVHMAYAGLYRGVVLRFATHRLAEAVMSVASFGLWGFFFSALHAAGVEKMEAGADSQDAALPAAVVASPSRTRSRSRSSGGGRSKKRVGGKSRSGSPGGRGREPAPGTKPLKEHDDSQRSIDSNRWWQDHRIVSRASSLSMNLWWLSANVLWYVGLIEVFHRTFGAALAESGVIPPPPSSPDPPTFLRVVVEVSFSVWAYDFLFYGIHKSFHSEVVKSGLGGIGRWWNRVHLTHHDHYKHTNEPLHVLVTFHHHLLDALLQVTINIIVQQVALSFLFDGHRLLLSKLLHNIVVTYLLVEAHSGFDLWFMSHRVFPSVFGGSVRHQMHHHSGGLYFHQFFKYLDDAFAAPHNAAVGTKSQ